MPKALDLHGQTFGRLTVLYRVDRDRTGAWRWACRCTCARVVTVRGTTLNLGRTSACSSCATAESNRTHGASQSPLYRRWRGMLARTGNPNNAEWENYGGRGINVCAEWSKFENFARDMGPTFDPTLELERIDNDGDYTPANCRWASRVEQQNNRRTNHRVEWQGIDRTVTEWAQTLGLKPNTIVHRLRRGWPTERALTTGASAAALLELANGAHRG